MRRFVLNPGHHALRDRGAVGLTGLRESDVVRNVVLALCPLAGEGIAYEPKRQGVLGLKTLTWALRRNPPDALLSLHCNSSVGAIDRHECHAIYWEDDPNSEREESSRRLAEAICFHAIGSFAQKALVLTAPYKRKRPDGSTYWLTPGILRNTARQAAVLVELGFINDVHVEAEMRKPEWVARAATALNAAVNYWASCTPEQ